MEDIRELIGTIGALLLVLAFMNFWVKYINRNFVMKLKNRDNILIKIFTIFMKYITKYHRYIAGTGVTLIIIHGTLMFLNNGLNPIGGLTLLLVITSASIGAYGYYINKNYKAVWLKIHRALAFIIMILILIHINTN